MGLMLTLCVAGCGDSSSSSADNEQLPATRPWFAESELIGDPSLAVRPDQVVVLDLAARRPGAAFVNHVIPYNFDKAGDYRFCIPEDEPHVRAAELFDRDERSVVRIVPSATCQRRSIEPGEYRLIVEHDGRGIPDEGRRAFIHVPRLKDTALTSAPGEPTPGGFVSCNALAVLSTYLGTYLVRGSGSPYPAVTQSGKVDLATGGWQICQDSHGAYQIYLTGPTPQLLSNTTFGTQAMFLESDGRVTVRNNGSPSGYVSAFDLIDLGDFQFQLWTAAVVNNVAAMINPVVVESDNNLHWDPVAAPQHFGVAAKYYKTQVTPPPLQVGEVMVQPSCTYLYGAWIVRQDISDTTALSYSNPQDGTHDQLGNACTSGSSCGVNMGITLGPDTVATFYSSPGYKNPLATVTTKYCATSLQHFASMRVIPARDYIISSNQCINCNLTGIDLSRLNLTAGTFNGSTFTHADLTLTDLTRANLNNANLSPATLTDTNLADAAIHSTNFRSADLTTVNAVTTQGPRSSLTQRADLTGASLSKDTFLPADWKYLNLTNAIIPDLDGATLSSADAPTDFSGAKMAGVVLSKAVLDGASFDCDESVSPEVCTDLTNASFNKASLKRASFRNAVLQGAHFDFANLDSANLCGAKLNQSSNQASASMQGTYLRNVNMYQANLTGVNLSNADFYSTTNSGSCLGNGCGKLNCASAQSATLDFANFSNAYLAGTDFSGASCKATTFTDAFLPGANFTGVNLGSADDGSGRVTSFRGAYLQGAKLSLATSVHNATFEEAYVDPNTAEIKMRLQSDNISFTGFVPLPTPNGGCVEFTYPAPSSTPPTDGSNTCPNGNPGPCTEWVLPTPTPGCSAADFGWSSQPTPPPTS